MPHSAKTRGKDRSRKNSRDSQASSSSSRRCSPSPSHASAVTRTRSLKDLRHKGDLLQTFKLVLVGNLQKVKHLAKKLTNYKKSKTADLSQNIDACNNESTELHRSRNSIQVQVALLLHSYHVRSRYKYLQRDDLDMEDMFHDSERDGRRKSSFIEHISNLLKSIL